MTEGNGPWGRRAWSYDRISNRLEEEVVPPDADLPERYGYGFSPNAAGGNTPQLARIEPAPGGEPGSRLDYRYDATGDQTEVENLGAECSARTSFLDYSAERRLARLHTSDGTGTTELSYDGRGFLARSRLTFSDSNDFAQTEPVYSSEGLLLARRFHQQTTRGGDGDAGPPTQPVTKHTTSLLYFAGRPVAQLRRHEAGGGPDELLFLTTDHLGVSILATDAAGAAAWEGGLDPFGTPFILPRTRPPGEDEPPPPEEPPPGDGDALNACDPEEPEGFDATEPAGLFLRFPGQWDDPSFHSHGLRGGLYYNLHRWYEPQPGRYAQPDPLGLRGGLAPYRYARSNPLSFYDPLGLKVYRCCRDVEVGGWQQMAAETFGLQHCFIKTDLYERGMGPADNGPLPACPMGVPTAVVDHRGQSDDPGTTCVEITYVEEDCVNGQLADLGRSTGRWQSWNNCNTFVDDVFDRCRKKCFPGPDFGSAATH